MIQNDLRGKATEELIGILDQLDGLRKLAHSRGDLNAIDCQRDRAAALIEKQRRRGRRLTVEQVRNIFTRLAAGERQRTIADDARVSEATISSISCGRIWSDLHKEFYRRARLEREMPHERTGRTTRIEDPRAGKQTAELALARSA